MCGSTCFGRFLAHHQEHTLALAASGFTFGAGGSSVIGRGRETMNINPVTTTLQR